MACAGEVEYPHPYGATARKLMAAVVVFVLFIALSYQSAGG
jgi:hypothetical protein